MAHIKNYSHKNKNAKLSTFKTIIGDNFLNTFPYLTQTQDPKENFQIVKA